MKQESQRCAGASRAEPKRVDCWLCGWPVAIGENGSDRVHLYCMECGMQVIIHSAAGANRLRDLVARERCGIEPRWEMTA